ncbi:hypothetical protein Tco_0688546, partial [Tanacetum coccineum]
SQSTDNKDADEVPGKGDDGLSEINGQEKEEGASNKEDDQHVQDFRAELDNSLVQQKGNCNPNLTSLHQMANLDFYDKHNMVAYLQKSEGSEGFHQIIDFLTTSHISTLENGDMEIITTIDGKVKYKRLLLPHKRCYIAPTLTQKLFSNMKRASKGYTGVDTPLFQTMLVQGQILQGEGSTIPVKSHHTPICTPSTSQPPTSPPSIQTTYVAKEAATMPHDSPLSRVHSLRSDEGSMTLNELTYSTEDNQEDPSKQGKKISHIDEEDYTAEPDISTAGAEVSTASPEVKTAKKTKLQLEQERLGLEEALRLQEQLDEEERQRIARVHEKASTFNAEEWDNIQDQIEVDEELAHRLQAQERERYTEADKARLLVELINERKRKFAQQRAEQRRNKPMTQAQQRTYMYYYIKHMGSHTLQQLKKLSFDEIKELFETTMKRGSFTQKTQEKYGNHQSSQTRESIMKRYDSTEPTEDKERDFGVELKRLFEPDDMIFYEASKVYAISLKWRLYDTLSVSSCVLQREDMIFSC